MEGKKERKKDETKGRKEGRLAGWRGGTLATAWAWTRPEAASSSLAFVSLLSCLGSFRSLLGVVGFVSFPRVRFIY